ncbi:hypothetical protein [Nocardia sp. NPDC059239]|uniref:hypothetical protein n=1 Tax=unclassified Nocardia TaxID=2637762 RepID=UPI00368E79B3
MDISLFGKSRVPDFDEMSEIGGFLLSNLSAYLGSGLLIFREHYVEEGSFALTFRSDGAVNKALAIQIEGSLLFDIHPDESLPLIDAEVLVFTFGKRMGLRSNSGNSYLRISYDVAGQGWSNPVWLADTPEDWERVVEMRESDYQKVKITYDRKE